MNKKIETHIKSIYKKYHSKKYLNIDPLLIVHRYKSKKEIEIVGLLSALLAYGKVEIIIRSIEKIISLANNNILEFVFETSYTHKKKTLINFKHRFNDGEDIATLLESIKKVYKKWGSLENLFLDNLNSSDGSMKKAMNNFSDSFLSIGENLLKKQKRSFSYFFPKPSGGSGCKRLNMYFRWMVRDADGIDLGVWRGVTPKILIIPVDVHISRIGQKFNLTKRKNSDWKAAEEITEALKILDKNDPIKFDFSLCHFGMLVN